MACVGLAQGMRRRDPVAIWASHPPATRRRAICPGMAKPAYSVQDRLPTCGDAVSWPWKLDLAVRWSLHLTHSTPNHASATAQPATPQPKPRRPLYYRTIRCIVMSK